MEIVNDVKEQDGGQHDATKPGIGLLDSLPEILSMIFGYLSTQDKGRAARVCVAWREAAMVKSLWKNVTAKLRLVEPPSQQLIATLARRSVTSITVLNLSGNHLCDVVAGVGASLKELFLVGCENVPDAMLARAFMKEMPNLVSLKLCGGPSVTDVTVSLVATNVRHLHSLSLQSCGQLTDTSLLLVVEYLRGLTSLYLQECDALTDSGIGYLAGVDPLQAREPVQLTCLYVCNCRQLTDATWLLVGTHMKTLSSILVGPSSNMTDASMSHLSQLTTLKKLHLSGAFLKNAWLHHFAEETFNIGKLDLLFCHHVTNSGLGSIAGLYSLRTLRIENCKQIGDDGLLVLAKHGAKFSELTIKNCLKVTDKGLKHLLGLSSLRSLKFQNCPNVGIPGLEYLAEGESKIDTLVLAGCQKMDRTALRVIASGLFHLRTLILERGHINKHGLSLAAKTLTKLEGLLADGKELMYVVRHLRSLS